MMSSPPTAVSVQGVRGQKQAGDGELLPRVSSQCTMCHGAGDTRSAVGAQARALNPSSLKTSQAWEKGGTVGPAGPDALKVTTCRPKVGRGAAFSPTNTPPTP